MEKESSFVEASKSSEVSILGIKVTSLSKEELVEYIAHTITCRKKEIILHVNVYAINLAQKIPWLRKMFNTSPVVFCDGDGVRLASRFLGHTIKEKITYNRFIWYLAEISEKRSLSWYMVGSENIVIKKAKEVLQEKYPKLNILNYRSGFFSDEKEIVEFIQDVNTRKPNILIVGMGMPLQEKLLADYFQKMEVNVALTGGAVFEYVSGEAKMTPEIFYRLKLEWFYRLINDPRRLFSRYVIGNPLFYLRVLREKLRMLTSQHRIT